MIFVFKTAYQVSSFFLLGKHLSLFAKKDGAASGAMINYIFNQESVLTVQF